MMKKLSISAKMIMAFAGLLAMIAGIGAFAVFKIGEVNDLSAQMRTRWLPATQLIGDLHAYTSQYRIAQSGLSWPSILAAGARLKTSPRMPARPFLGTRQSYGEGKGVPDWLIS